MAIGQQTRADVVDEPGLPGLPGLPVPPLESGDRLSRAELERRFAAARAARTAGAEFQPVRY